MRLARVRGSMRLNLWSPYEPIDEDRVARDAPPATADLSRIYRSEAPRLHRFFARRGHLIDDAADLVQRSFVRLLGLSCADRDAIEVPGAYLTRIASNLARDEARAARRKPSSLVLSREVQTDPAFDPSHQLEARDMLARVDAAIAALPERTREIFMAHRFEGLTYPAIAGRLGISVKTVEKHMSLALAALHRLLADAE